MDSVIKQLSDIETTAEAIVDHAKSQKSEIEKKIQGKRDAFDEELEARTQDKIKSIQTEAQTKMDKILTEQREKNHFMLDNLQKEYEENHEVYAKEILERIVEV